MPDYMIQFLVGIARVSLENLSAITTASLLAIFVFGSGLSMSIEMNTRVPLLGTAGTISNESDVVDVCDSSDTSGHKHRRH